MDKEKKISLIEIDYHPEVLRNTLIILDKLPFRCEVYTSQKIWKQANIDDKLQKTTPILFKKKGNINHFFKSNLERINTSDFIFFNTLASKFKLFYKLNFTPPIILRLHNANAYLQPFKNIDPRISLFYLWKDTSYLVLNVFFKLEINYRNKFVNERVNYFTFPSEEVTDYVLRHNYVPESKVIKNIPFSFSLNKSFSKIDNNKIVISIIGRIDKRTRNYEEVYNAFSKLIPNLKEKVELKLLGKPIGLFGKKIVKRFRKLENKNFSVTYFESFIPQEKFEDHIRSTHFLLLPTFKKTRYKIFKELYGYTKISGNINDIIVYRKPAIIPAFYPLPKNLNLISKTFMGSDGLTNAIEEWINSKQYENLEFDKINNEYNLNVTTNKVWDSLISIK